MRDPISWQKATENVADKQHAYYYDVNLKAVGTAAVTLYALSVLRRSHVGALPLILGAAAVAWKGIKVLHDSGLESAACFEKERYKQFTKINPRVPLEPCNASIQKATETLPHLFYLTDISDVDLETLKLPEALHSIERFEPLLQGIRWTIYGCVGLSILYGLKALKEGYNFATSLKMPPIRSIIPSVFRFGARCIWGGESAMGDALLAIAKLGISGFILERSYGVIRSRYDLAAERIECVLKRKIQLAIEQSGSTSKTLLDGLPTYSEFVKSLNLEHVRGDRLAEIAPHLTHLKKLTIQSVSELNDNQIEKTFTSLKDLTYLQIAKSDDTLNDEWLKKALLHLPNLKTLVIKEAQNVNGSFWEVVPGTVTYLEMPEFDQAVQLGKGHSMETYEEVTIGKVSENGASQLQRSLYAKKLTLSSLEQPGQNSVQWERLALENALESQNISSYHIPY